MVLKEYSQFCEGIPFGDRCRARATIPVAGQPAHPEVQGWETIQRLYLCHSPGPVWEKIGA